MKRQLDRLLRIRGMLEDLSRLDFEGKSAAMRALERGAEKQRQMALGARAETVEEMAAGQPMERGSWRMRLADAEIFGWRKARLEAMAQAAKPGVEQAREELLERRVERRQAEILHEAAVRGEEKQLARQDQNRTDDWFQSRAARGKRK
jgi:hypothetical protein